MRFHYYMGLILKCNEIKEKIRHLKRGETRHPSVSIFHTTRGGDAYLEVLHQVIKYPQAFWVLTILDIDQRTDFCRLDERKRKKGKLVD